MAAASVLLTLLALEAAFRVAHVPVGTVQINRATVRRSDDPRLRFELRPGGCGARRGRVPRQRARPARTGDDAREAARACGASRVLGDSIAFGYWVADEHGFARQLEAMLRAVPGGGRVEVLNFAVPGYNLEQEIETLRTKALAFAPDLVVVRSASTTSRACSPTSSASSRSGPSGARARSGACASGWSGARGSSRGSSTA